MSMHTAFHITEDKKRAQGRHIFYGWFNSPYGESLVMGENDGLCGISFAAEMTQDAVLADMQHRWPKATFEEQKTFLDSWAKMALWEVEDNDYPSPLPLLMIGTDFQIKIWKALLSIRRGDTTTYETIAKSVGQPKAVRATGTAVGQNPLGILVPCHRVLRKDGSLGGYHWGIDLKQKILAQENRVKTA